MATNKGWWRCFCGAESTGTLADYQDHYLAKHAGTPADPDPGQPGLPAGYQDQATIDGEWEAWTA